MNSFAFEEVGRLPVPQDNIAIATRLLPAGTEIHMGDESFRLSHAVLLGHRFAVRPIAKGEKLLSWGQSFGIATKNIAIGDYVCNADVLKELGRRSLEIDLPIEANFENDLENYRFDEANFKPAKPLERYSERREFLGYVREGGRGVGTRNTIILLATSSLCTGFVRKLESQLKSKLTNYPNIDAIVALAHTEGGHGKPNNEGFVLRSLAGFVVHPNVAAVLIVDYPHTSINNATLQNYLHQNAYPLDSVLHEFMSLGISFEEDLKQAENLVEQWFESVNAMQRSPQSISELKIALQCGGSDAFSGISGNPLAAWVAKEVIQYGGAANLAETDELIGAETYILDKVRDAETAKKFLNFIERFKERVGWHGHSAEGNPSGGNKFRGLYNIYLKSLGAASKRHPDVPLDFAIEYGEKMTESGYYFMDSPGNDLESIAGQVASGCNLIFFITGNGSITNFPFVPTIKIVTTTERYQLLENDMDFNAGAYLEGTPLERLGAELLDYTLEIASGKLSIGEKAGHSQVQLWRDWQQTQPVKLELIQNQQATGKAIPIDSNDNVPDIKIPFYHNGNQLTSRLLGLVLPTSLCSGQIARMTVESLNKNPNLKKISNFVSFAHTEGCGGSVNNEFRDTLLGYLGHPFIQHALLLEHGCEATHNDYFLHAMQARGFHPEDYGWASIQLDGGIQKVMRKINQWFEKEIANSPSTETVTAGLEAFKIAILSNGELSETVINYLAEITKMIVEAGGTVILQEHDTLLESDYAQAINLEKASLPSLNYAQAIPESGFHIMAMPTRDWGEILTGIGAAGVELILCLTEHQAMTAHPMIPVLQMSEEDIADVDFILDSNSNTYDLLDLMIATLQGNYSPKMMQAGNVNFQVTRGLLGVSL